MNFIFFFIWPCTALKIINHLKDTYYLVKNEYFIVNLDDYFSGDSLIYSIFPTENTNLTSPYINSEYLNSTEVAHKTSEFTSIIQSLNSKNSNQNYLILAGTSDLSLVFIDSEMNQIKIINTLSLNSTVLQVQTINPTLIFVMTVENNENVLLYISLYSQFGSVLYFNDPFPLNLTEIAQVQSISISTGLITSQFLVTGYLQLNPVIFVYSLSEGEVHLKKGPISFSLTRFDLDTIFAVTSNTSHFFYLPQSQVVVSAYFGNNVPMFNELYIGEYTSKVFSMQLSSDNSYLLLGIVNGFLVISFDFEQVFFKNLYSENQAVYMTSISNDDGNIFALVQGDTGFNVKVTNLDGVFNVIGNFSIEIRTKFTQWGTFSYLNSLYFVYTESENIILTCINLSQGTLNFTSSEEIQSFNISASEGIDSQMIMQTFSVIRPSKEIGSVQVINSDYQVYNAFSINSTEFYINFYDLFIGYYLELENWSITYEGGENFFAFSMEIVNDIINTTLPVEVYGKNLNEIIVTNSFIFVYNETYVEKLSPTGEMIHSSNFEVPIKKVMFCDSLFLVYYEQNNKERIAVTEDLTSNFTIYSAEVLNVCDKLMCSSTYIVCGNKSEITVLSLIDPYTPFQLFTYFNFTDFYLFNQNFLALIIGSTFFRIYDLALYTKTNLPIEDLNFVFSLNLENSAKLTFASINYIYIIFETFLNVYDSDLKFLKEIVLTECYLWQNVFYIEEVLVFVTEGKLFIVNSTDIVSNSFFYRSDSVNIKSVSFLPQDSRTLYVLTSEELYSIQVPTQYGLYFCKFSIYTQQNLSLNYYVAYLNLTVSNYFSQSSTVVSVNLYLNGQIIYINESSILQTYDVTCGQSLTINLDNIFIGQDINATTNDTSLATISPIIQQVKAIEIGYNNFESLFYVKVFNFSIVVNNCNVNIYSFDFSEVLASFELAQEGEFNCECKSITTIFDNSTYLGFVVGCVYTPDVPELDSVGLTISNVINFLSYNMSDLALMATLQVSYPPDNLFSINSVDGSFFLMAIDLYEEVSENGFFCNHLSVVTGEFFGSQNFSVKLISPVQLNVSYYYIIDFTGIFDPMFQVYYLYLVDIFTGLNVVKIDSKLGGSSLSQITSDSPFNSIAKCGNYLYLVNNNAEVFTFYFDNWGLLQLTKTIYTYNKNLAPIPRTLSCSDYENPEYLMITMVDQNGQYFLQLINNNAEESSGIISETPVPDNFTVLYSYFINSNNILCITNTNLYEFVLTPFEVIIYPHTNCQENSLKNFKIVASNKLKTVAKTFTVQIFSNYSPPNVTSGNFPFYWWIIIAFCVVLLIIISIITYKKTKKKRKTSTGETELFNFEFFDGN